MKKLRVNISQSDVVPLCWDAESEEFWRGGERLRLSRKPFTMLRLLVERRPRWVSKDDFYNEIWKPKDEDVMDWTFSTYVYDIRKALGDEKKPHRYIETGANKGYRFIGILTNSDQSQQGAGAKVETSPAPLHRPQFRLDPNPQPPLPYVVGRETELGRMRKILDRVLAGERQLVFITGEPGIGKTTLVRTFLREVASNGTAAIGRGQCIEQYGPGEAYLPVLEAIGRLGRNARDNLLIEWLKQYTPTWLVQMPTLLSPGELEEVQRRVQGSTRERMLREMSEGIEVLTEQIPFILVLEDLHWSDVSTLDLISSLARRPEPARLLIIGTYRPEEGLAEGHPLRAITQEIQGHRLCQDIALPPFTKADVSAYLHRRLPVATLPTRLPEILYHSTGGSPLFLAAVVDDLIERGVISQTDEHWVLQGQVDAIANEVPVSIRQLFTRRIERLQEQEQQIMQAASVAGQEFSAAAVAAAVGISTTDVEKCCEALVQRQHFLRPLGYSEWPDGVRAARYGFRHALYQYLWNERIPIGQRQQLHLRIGERLEHGYRGQAGEIAAELALHFEEGRDYARAIRYLQQAAQNALLRSANAEAIRLLTKGIELLKVLPDTAVRVQQELNLQTTLGPALIANRGYAAPEIAQTYARARELCQQVGEAPQLSFVLWGLYVFYLTRAEYQTAQELGEQLLALAQRNQDPLLLLLAHGMLGVVLFHRGEPLSARVHVEKGAALYDPRQHHTPGLQYGQDPGITCLAQEPLVLWILGFPDQARQRSRDLVNLSRTLDHPHSLAHALAFSLTLYQFQRDWEAMQTQTKELIKLATEQDFALWQARVQLWEGALFSRQGRSKEGICKMQQAITAWQATGAELGLPLYLTGLVEVYGEIGRSTEGLSILSEALARVKRTGEHFWEAELYRLKGDLLLKSHLQGSRSKVKKDHESKVEILEREAERCFQKAIEIARLQSAKSLELRATVSVSRLWQRQGRRKEAFAMLAAIYNWFTEGFGTADLCEAKALLDELSTKDAAPEAMVFPSPTKKRPHRQRIPS